MAKKNLIVTLVTTKGGSGKTTLACCLAGELLHRSRAVTLIDADPQQGSGLWHSAGGPLQAATLITDPTQGLAAKARQAASAGPVLIDVAGAATQTTIAALQAADVVLVPCQASALDALQAINTVAMAADVGKAERRRLPVYVVLNRISNAAIVPHIRAELERAGVKVARAEIGQRTAFAVAALNGTAPCWMGATAEKAAAEIAALVKELGLY
jgi:chromosome partitioning protein